MVLQDLRDGLEGREPRRAKRPPNLKEPALPTWGNPFVYVQIEYPLSDNKALVPPAEIEDEVQALWWIGSRLNEEWGGKNRVITTLPRNISAAKVAAAKACFEKKKDNPIQGNPFDCFDGLPFEDLIPISRVAFDFALFALLPVLAVLVMGVVISWIISGFKTKSAEK
jgi:hypothetical protein